MRKNLLFISLLFPITLFGQNFEKKKGQNDDVLSSFIKLSTQKLYDTAIYYYNISNYDTALICYNLIINTIPKNADIEQQKKLAKSYRVLANIYFFISDYRIAYDLYIKALLISEEYDLLDEKIMTYSNIGVLYSNINQYNMAKQFYLKALDLCKDSVQIMITLNNLGFNEIKGKSDSAYYYLEKSIQINKKINENAPKYSLLNTIAMYYQNKKQYDSALHYFHSSLHHSKINKNLMVEVINLSDLGKMFFEVKKIDSALYYIGLSNKIASENKFLTILADNYLTLSEIEKSKGKYKSALNYHIIYTNLKDSIYNGDVISSINLLQRQYEVSKTNKQIGKLVFDMNIKENKIRVQRINWYITLGILAVVCFVLYIFALQKIKINKAYNHLVEKNVENIELQKTQLETQLKTEVETKTEIEVEKTRKKVLNENQQDELLKNIIAIMNTPSIICNADFTIIQLAELTHSNQKYVSEAINDGLNKNFNTLLNSYRVKEAQRLFAELDPANYTIENIAHKVGFKSRNTFNEAFKEITKVSPSFYFKSISKQKK